MEQVTGQDPMQSGAMMALMGTIDELSAGMTQVRIWQANLEMSLKNISSAVKTNFALDMEMDASFLVNLAKTEWKVADATNNYRMAFEKIVRMKSGNNLGHTIGKWIRKGTDPRGN